MWGPRHKRKRECRLCAHLDGESTVSWRTSGRQQTQHCVLAPAGAQSFGGAHRGRVCVRVFIGVSVRACCDRLHCTV
jgi:hypothetical protein